ncbi:AMP-binding protein [Agromyces protaetiae]|nr:AMP-binding protein [Agromyces protaetiae]
MSDEAPDLFEALQRTAAKWGNDRGIRWFDSPDHSDYIGFADLEREARTIGASIQAAGFGIGTTAVIAVGSGLDWPGAVFGAMAAGVTFMPAPVSGYGSAEYLTEGVAAIARSGDAGLLIVDRGTLERLDGLSALGVPVLLIEDLRAGDPDAWVDPGLTPDDIAYLLFTSGSTGDPKGVIATHGMIVRTSTANKEAFNFTDDSVMVGWAPMHHIMGLLSQVIVPAVNGTHSVTMPTEQFQKRPLGWLQLISTYRGTYSAAGNFAFDLVTRLVTDEQIADLDLRSLKGLFCGSEPIRPETMRAFIDKFAPAGITDKVVSTSYGMTETGMITGKFPEDDLVIRRFDREALESGRLVPSDGEGSVEWVSCGRPDAYTTVQLVDPDTLLPVEDGVVGEVWANSPVISPGYFRRPDATAETFGLKLPGDDLPYMRTGDLAARLDGQLFVTGRLKEMLIIRGRNIYPMDIEAAAREVSPAVGIGAVFELTDHDMGVGIVAELDAEALAASGETVDELAERLRKELAAKFSLPYLAVAFVEPGRLPRTGTGKVRRTPTRRQLGDGTLATVHTLGFAMA